MGGGGVQRAVFLPLSLNLNKQHFANEQKLNLLCKYQSLMDQMSQVLEFSLKSFNLE